MDHFGTNQAIPDRGVRTSIPNELAVVALTDKRVGEQKLFAPYRMSRILAQTFDHSRRVCAVQICNLTMPPPSQFYYRSLLTIPTAQTRESLAFGAGLCNEWHRTIARMKDTKDYLAAAHTFPKLIVRFSLLSYSSTQAFLFGRRCAQHFASKVAPVDGTFREEWNRQIDMANSRQTRALDASSSYLSVSAWISGNCGRCV